MRLLLCRLRRETSWSAETPLRVSPGGGSPSKDDVERLRDASAISAIRYRSGPRPNTGKVGNNAPLSSLISDFSRSKLAARPGTPTPPPIYGIAIRRSIKRLGLDAPPKAMNIDDAPPRRGAARFHSCFPLLCAVSYLPPIIVWATSRASQNVRGSRSFVGP